MKAKTIWEDYMTTKLNYGYTKDGVVFNDSCDARWINTIGRRTNEVDLDFYGKIIGDLDE